MQTVAKKPITAYYSGVVGNTIGVTGTGLILANDAAEPITCTCAGVAFSVKQNEIFDDEFGDFDTVIVDPATLGTKQVETATVATPGVAQVETATVVGTIGAEGAGNATVIVTSAGMTGSPKTVSVAVANNDTASQVAAKIITALQADAAIGHTSTGKFTVGGTGANVVLTAKVAAANDATLNVSIDNGTCTGITAAPTSANTTAGKAQAVETSGNLTVTVTIASADTVLTIPVVAGETAAQVATKVRAAMAANATIAALFTVGGANGNVVLTGIRGRTNDATLNIAIANDTSAGVSNAATSADTTAGVAATAIAYRLWVRG